MQELPHDEDIEAAVLRQIMIDNSSIEKVIDVISEDSFYIDAHKILFRCIKWLYDNNMPIDLLTVTNAIKQNGYLERIGGPYYIACLGEGVVSSVHIEAHMDILTEKATKRNIINICSVTLSEAYNNNSKANDLIDKYEKGLTGITSGIVGDKTYSSGDLHSELLKRNQSLLDNKGVVGVLSGFSELDKIIGGWRNQTLIILAARPSMGKSSFCKQLAANPAINKGEPVAVFSLEESKELMYSCMLGQQSGIDIDRITRYGLTHIEISQLNQKLVKAPIYIDDTPSISVFALRNKARKLKREKNIKLIIIDYLQLMTAGIDFKGNREQEISYISRSLKGLSKELDIPIIALSQLSRGLEGRASKRPMLSDLRECLSYDTSMIYTNKSFQNNTNSQMNLLSLNKSRVVNMNSHNIPKTQNTVFRLKTATGRFIDGTANHLVLTSDGYKKICDISEEDSIALAVGWENEDGKYIEESRFIGWMIGNGCMYGYNVPSFITNCQIVSDDFCKFISDKFGFNPKFHKHHISKVFQWDITKNTVRTPEGNPVTKWLKENDLWGSKAKDKKIPQWFMETANEKSIIELIQGLWETDGSIQMGAKRQIISYGTTSLFLANQIMYLLAKIGIICHIDDGYFSDKATTMMYKIIIGSSAEKTKFNNKIKLRGYKGERQKAMEMTSRQSYLSNILGRSTTVEIFNEIKKYTSERFIQIHGKRRLTKDKLIEIISFIHKDFEKKYSWLISDSIFWDKVEKINDIGVVDIFDRSVPVSNNFVVNGIIVHNSGAIEQDADIVIFIHRPEYFGIKEDSAGTSTAGKAEILIAKHRSGSLADILLNFEHAKTLFSDYQSTPIYSGNKVIF